MLASLNGGLLVLMRDGQIDAFLVEAAGLDLGEVMFSLVGEKPDPVSIQCFYSRFSAQGGLLEVKQILAASNDSNFTGDGKVNFDRETYELVIEARPKDPSILTGSSPVRIYGDFGSYHLDVISGELIARGALSLATAALFPPAALLPLVDPGIAEEESGCQRLLAEHSETTGQH